MSREYIDNIKKVRENRHYKITNSYGVSDSYNYYCKNGGKLSKSEFSKIVNLTNTLLKETILKGKEVSLPMKMGHLEVRKFLTSVSFKDGKLKTNLPVDWQKTLQLWEEDKEAEAAKILVRRETPQIFRVFYHKGYATYKNKLFYNFSVNRQLKLELKKKILEEGFDAFTF